jgi:hypothetical protein
MRTHSCVADRLRELHSRQSAGVLDTDLTNGTPEPAV